MELEKHLVLNKYFLNLFGFDEFDELREKLKGIREGEGSQGRSFFINVLISLRPELETQLLEYDEAIREYTERLRQNRRQPDFNLKYFQYLAVLFTEIFLDKYYNGRERFLNELNEFLEEFNNKNGTEIPPFTEYDLRKLAFWMATGSGKTIIMHINYWQVLKYSKNDWDNIILITPNEGLSKQHYEQLRLSGIPCKLYDGNINNLKTKGGEVLVIDIHKLTKEKRGKGVSVDVSYFDGKNLVFIDEGHKGAGGESEAGWKNLREEVAKNGFMFEYSATFGQIIEFTRTGKPKSGKSNQTNIELYNEYAKAIIFSYPYKYFYKDGYGKDFYVYNIKEDSYTEDQQDLLLTANLLAFYEQTVLFERYQKELGDYNIKKPLWIFVGSTVIGKEGRTQLSEKERKTASDVVRIVNFLNKILGDEKYLEENIRKILDGESGLLDQRGNDVFKDKFEYIKCLDRSGSFSVNDVYEKVFGGKGRLELYEIKNAEGEIGLKTATSEKYFGVINVGDVSSLKKLIRKSEIEVKEDHFSNSLFFDINKDFSTINILIGSKKFIEGWDSWRVSNMGLINMGKGEGPQIIQLFGRGVRLKGKNSSLKREENPDYKLKALQTLHIFGLNADYMNAFLTAIEKEEVDYEELAIPIKFNMPERWENKIYTIKTKEDFDFTDFPVKLTLDEDLLRKIKMDLRPKITLAHGLRMERVETAIDEPVQIPIEYLGNENNKEEGIIDWNRVYLNIMNYKIRKGYFNLIIDKETLKDIIRSRKYQLYITQTRGISIENNGKPVLKAESFEGVEKLHKIIEMILKEYITRFYRREEKKKTMDYLTVEPLTTKHENMYPEDYKVVLKIPRSLLNDFKDLIKQIEEYSKNERKIPEEWKNWNSVLIHFDKHLYTPLIVYRKGKEEIKSVPVMLNKGETKFVEDLRNFINRRGDLFGEADIFLLRNLSRRGIGFFISTGFYPDFIIWIRKGNKQKIIFADPKGIRNVHNFDNEKIQLCTTYIKEIENKVKEVIKSRGESINLELDAFIVSFSEYDDIKQVWEDGRFKDKSFDEAKEEFEKHHIIFQEDKDYIEKLVSKMHT